MGTMNAATPDLRKRPEDLAMRRRVLAALPLFAALAGCAGSASEQFGQSVWVAPGKYQFHDCLQAQEADRSYATRQRELEELMARASKGPGGDVVNTMVYRSEYQQVLGERKEIAQVFVQKRCTLDSKRSSDRQVF
jgi:hypothetical protein